MADPTITGVVTAFNSILKLFQVINESKVSVEVRGRLTELYGVIVAGQQSALESTIKQQAMLEEIRQLKEELASVKAWEGQRMRYKLISPWEGAPAVVYALKESCKGTEAPHWICTKCYDDGRRTVLQPKHDAKGFVLLACPTCRSETHSGYRGIGPAAYAQD